MVVAMLVMLNFLGKNVQVFAALVGGVGFGAFIDEMGKFITHDNDYFYRPAVAIIYSIFIGLFLLLRTIQTFKNFDPREFLANTLREFETIGRRQIDTDEKKRLLFYLSHCDEKDAVVRRLKELVENLDTRHPKKPHAGHLLKRSVRDGYYKIARLPWFRTAVITFFIVGLGLKVGQITYLAWLKLPEGSLSFVDRVQLGSAWISGLFVLLGVIKMKRSRYAAYKMFEYAVFVSICVTQIFTFYKEQLYALFGLAFNILLIVLLRYMIARERPTGERIP